MSEGSEGKVWAIASRQNGIVARRQALAVGMTDRMISSRLRRGLWKVLKPGVYVLPGHVQTLQGLLAAATAALGAVVSHESAAELHGISYIRRGLAVVTVPVRRTNRFPAVKVHQSTDLSATHVVEIDRLPVTTVARTTIDLASVISRPRLEKVVDWCLGHGLVRVEELRAAFDELARRGKPGTTNCRAVLDLFQPGYIPTESELEFQALEHFREWGLPEPVRQFELVWRSPGPGRVDFAYPWARLLIEIDGRSWHMTMQAFDQDRMRDNLAQIAGWRIIRITYRMLMDRPAEVRQLIEQALASVA